MLMVLMIFALRARRSKQPLMRAAARAMKVAERAPAGHAHRTGGGPGRQPTVEELWEQLLVEQVKRVRATAEARAASEGKPFSVPAAPAVNSRTILFQAADA
jgi:hypothetical protein